MAKNIVNIKFTKFDNTPWGFRLAGGSDFPQPLTVIRVIERSLAECMGLKVGDVVVRLNDQPISSLTHGQAHEELMRAGNNFVLGVQREEDPLKALEALSEENIVPYKIPLADLPPVFPEQILNEETVLEQREETICETKVVEEEAKPEVEPLPEKPKDENSEIVPNQNLTDDEIAQLILEEEELLDDKGVLGVNFKKLRPRATVLKQSKVIEELQNIATAEPPLVEQLRRTSVFLQKPQRPIPAPRKKELEEERERTEAYKVVIKKQKKRSVTDRLLEKGLLRPEDASTPEPPTPEVNMENNETGNKIEKENDSSVPATSTDDSPCSQNSIDDNPHSQQPIDDSPPSHETLDDSPYELELEIELEPTVACSEEPSSPPFELPIDVCQARSSVASIQLSKETKENVVLAGRESSKRKSKSYCTRAHYFRRCLFGKRSCDAKKVKARCQESGFTERLQQLSRRGSVERSRIKGRYLETYLKREDNWMRRMVDGLFEKPDSFSSSKLFDRLLESREISFRRTRYAEKILVRSVEFVADRLRTDILKRIDLESKPRIDRRLYFKPRYFQRIFWCNVIRLIDYIKSTIASSRGCSRDRRRSSIIKMRGRYLETYLKQNAFLDHFSPRLSLVSSKGRLFPRTRYVERILKKHFESLGLIINYVRCQVLQGISDTSAVIPGRASSLNSRQNRAPAKRDDDDDDHDVLSNLIRSSKDFIASEVFHRGSRRLSRSSRGDSALDLSNTWAGCLLNWLHLKFAGGSAISDKKLLVQDNDRDRRRLSFVPTILYEGLTNRIGVDFTRFVAYAFVPCTSIILLYMYK